MINEGNLSPEREMFADKMPREHLQRWEESKEFLIARALTACARMAESYRDFFVGSAMLSYDKGKNDYFLYHGGNYKPGPGEQKGASKRCAERRVLEKIAGDNNSEVIGMVIASSRTHAETDEDFASDFLCPCQECRQMFVDSKLLKSWTKILLLKLNPAIDQMDMAKFYENLGKCGQTGKAEKCELIEAIEEMDYKEFIEKIERAKIRQDNQ